MSRGKTLQNSRKSPSGAKLNAARKRSNIDISLQVNRTTNTTFSRVTRTRIPRANSDDISRSNCRMQRYPRSVGVGTRATRTDLCSRRRNRKADLFTARRMPSHAALSSFNFRAGTLGTVETVEVTTVSTLWSQPACLEVFADGAIHVHKRRTFARLALSRESNRDRTKFS